MLSLLVLAGHSGPDDSAQNRPTLTIVKRFFQEARMARKKINKPKTLAQLIREGKSCKEALEAVNGPKDAPEAPNPPLEPKAGLELPANN
tara:strand:+ start:273 stop:542 length:270 start_codon:yes stop_codon:yes gene_type:complete